MKTTLKVVAIVLVVYVAVVAIFESLLGYYQPAGGNTLVITTSDDDGTRHDRVLSSIESDGKLYVAANHWPRAWYLEALANPQVQVSREGTTEAYVAVPVTGAEHDKVDSVQPLGWIIRILTGFPPRYFLRLDPG